MNTSQKIVMRFCDFPALARWRHGKCNFSRRTGARNSRLPCFMPAKIVLLDDDSELCELTEAVIRGCLKDATMHSFNDGDSAWRELNTDDPDIFITDWNH